MKCIRCGATAYSKVGNDGYCGAHASYARASQAAIIRRREFGENEYAANQRNIERALRFGDTRHRTHRRHT